MMIVVFTVIATLFLAYTNGANDNFKGVATLFGSNTADYKVSIIWATVTTFAGAIAAIFISSKLLIAFSGKGIVPQAVVMDPKFLISVSLGAGMTVFIATIAGIPISTTHGLVGGLAGAGIVAVGSDINMAVLANKFFVPLIASPFIAAILAFAVYSFFRVSRLKLGIKRQMCLCADEEVKEVYVRLDGSAIIKATGLVLSIDELEKCQSLYKGEILGIDFQKIIDKFHFLSAGAVCFARSLNDVPKIAALLLVAKGLSLNGGTFIIGVIMCLGGLLNTRKVAITMSKRITGMNHGQGFSGNLVTSFLVIFASRWGVPVSTTHVSCGALFGIGTASGKADFAVIKGIILAWIFTLPMAGVISYITFLIIRNF